ncbi:MAG TPA: peptidoglycan bridge formation glycyltransferase FemA/FemB family protein [Ktedonobacterales bacterium]|nr:peptidoglycan bridge formation glycyltransferase FemA/FemB family protein [Ktedonobacterales bacterium]
MMEARLIDDRRMWNEFVAATSTGHLCQTYEWGDHSDDGPNTGALRVGVVEGGRLVAAMLLTRGKATGLPTPFYYAPRGPVCADPSSPAFAALIRCARQEARKRGAFMIRIEPNVPQDDAVWTQALRRQGFHPTDHVIYLRSAWVTDLRPSEDQLLAGMMTTWRQNIRSGARKGLTVRLGAGEADLDAFYRLLVETGARDHFYVYPKDLYRDMLANYSAANAARDATAQMALLLAEANGEAIAASTVAVLGEWSWNLHSGSSAQPEHRKLRPNYLLQWECMRWVKAHGAAYYDWRTIPDILEPGQELYGVYEFKRGFGGAVRRVIPTHDLPLRPAIYWPYGAAVSARRALQRMRRRRFERQRDREREAKQQGQAPGNLAIPVGADSK